jgi:hypothetical protein
MVYLLKMVIFHSYVSLPEGKYLIFMAVYQKNPPTGCSAGDGQSGCGGRSPGQRGECGGHHLRVFDDGGKR